MAPTPVQPEQGIRAFIALLRDVLRAAPGAALVVATGVFVVLACLIGTPSDGQKWLLYLLLGIGYCAAVAAAIVASAVTGQPAHLPPACPDLPNPSTMLFEREVVRRHRNREQGTPAHYQAGCISALVGVNKDRLLTFYSRVEAVYNRLLAGS